MSSFLYTGWDQKFTFRLQEMGVANHRKLSIRTFVQSIPPDLFQRYFQRLPPDQQPSSAWTYMNPDAMQEFLDKLHDAGDDAVILEDFRRINDISVLGTDLLVHAYQRVGGSFDSEQTAQSLAMRLFLDHPEAFEYAWSRYLFYRTTSKLASFPLEVPQLDVSEEQIGKFQGDLSKWLASQAKGKNCIINCYQDEDGSTLYVQRGAHLRTAPYWKDDKVEIISLRPASEDLLVYDQKRATLTIKAGLAKDREFY